MASLSHLGMTSIRSEDNRGPICTFEFVRNYMHFQVQSSLRFSYKTENSKFTIETRRRVCEEWTQNIHGCAWSSTPSAYSFYHDDLGQDWCWVHKILGMFHDARFRLKHGGYVDPSSSTYGSVKPRRQLCKPWYLYCTYIPDQLTPNTRRNTLNNLLWGWFVRTNFTKGNKLHLSHTSDNLIFVGPSIEVVCTHGHT